MPVHPASIAHLTQDHDAVHQHAHDLPPGLPHTPGLAAFLEQLHHGDDHHDEDGHDHESDNPRSHPHRHEEGDGEILPDGPGGSGATGNVLLDAITWGPGLPDNTITVYFAPAGTSVPGVPFPPSLRNVEGETWSDYEIGQFQKAFAAIEAVINVNFVTVTNPAQADLTLVLDTDEVTGNFLGIFNPPGTRDEGIGIFDGSQWDRSPGGDLEQGGFGYVTIVHELLHGLGLAHPHDRGGASGLLPGVSNNDDSDTGDFGLNQGLYTTMTYNSGYPNGPAGTVPPGLVGTNYGFEAGPMALDIAALQAIYGANTTHASGNSLYMLPGSNGLGTYWTTIWDTGGTDEIRYTGPKNTVFDLRAATLQAEAGGGGFLSAVTGTAGGVTIANGVIIENAQGGSGNDRFIGNDVGNLLNGADGFDTVWAGLGDDTILGQDKADELHGGAGQDLINGGQGFDLLYGEAGHDTLSAGGEPDRLYGGLGNDALYAGSNFSTTVDGLFGEAGNDTLYGQAGFDYLDGGEGDDLLDGGHQADNLFGRNGNDTMRGDLGFDRLFGGFGNDFGRGGDGDDGLFGDQGNDTLYGEAGNDRLFGGPGNDYLDGGSGNDSILAGAGFDTIVGGTGNDTMQGNFNADTFVFADGHGDDVIQDFDANNDFEKIDLSAVSAITTFADLSANHATQVGGNVVIDTGGGNSITLNGVSLADLDQADFLF